MSIRAGGFCGECGYSRFAGHCTCPEGAERRAEVQASGIARLLDLIRRELAWLRGVEGISPSGVALWIDGLEKKLAALEGK